MKNPVRIPEKVLAWRETKRKGSIMRPTTFRGIKRKAARVGYAIPSAVGGKAYWITVLNKYLDEYPGDKTAMRTLRKLLRGGKRSLVLKKILGRRNPSGKKAYVGVSLSRLGHKYKVFTSSSKPVGVLYRKKYCYVFGPFESQVEANRWVREGK